MDNDLDNVPIEFPGWQVVTSSLFSTLFKQTLPKQQDGYNYRLFAVIYLSYIASESVVDVHPGDMEMITKWAMRYY